MTDSIVCVCALEEEIPLIFAMKAYLCERRHFFFTPAHLYTTAMLKATSLEHAQLVAHVSKT